METKIVILCFSEMLNAFVEGTSPLKTHVACVIGNRDHSKKKKHLKLRSLFSNALVILYQLSVH